MKNIKWFFALCAVLALSCNTLSNSIATPALNTTGCPNSQPADVEVDQARAYMENQFTSADWKPSYAVMESRITVTRKNDRLGALINFDTVTFCNVSNSGLDNYYNDNTFNITFQYYDSHEFQTGCRFGDVRLYEMTLKNQGIDYNGRFWVEILDDNHIRETLLVFPSYDQKDLDEFSNKVMPDIPSCKK